MEREREFWFHSIVFHSIYIAFDYFKYMYEILLNLIKGGILVWEVGLNLLGTYGCIRGEEIVVVVLGGR